jgi:phosphoglycolate phosphatase-like HAD superfamily hydrolase
LLSDQLRQCSIVFWDFDGVIKETVDVKTEAYVRLFLPFGPAIAARVREHHENHGGVSRFEKVPLYLQWAGRAASPNEVARYCEQFSAAVFQAVLDAAWVPGAREYLRANHAAQRLVLVTGTPQAEIERILDISGIAECFWEVHGAPTAKASAITSALARLNCRCEDALMIGDSEADFAAALATNVPFLLRRTPSNLALQQSYAGPQCEDFLDG